MSYTANDITNKFGKDTLTKLLELNVDTSVAVLNEFDQVISYSELSIDNQIIRAIYCHDKKDWDNCNDLSDLNWEPDYFEIIE